MTCAVCGDPIEWMPIFGGKEVLCHKGGVGHGHQATDDHPVMRTKIRKRESE